MAGRKLKRLEIVRFATALLLVWAMEALAILEGLRIVPYSSWLIQSSFFLFFPGMGIESWLTVMRKGSVDILQDKVLAFGLLYIIPPVAAMTGRFVTWAMVLSIVWFAALMVRIGLIIARFRRQGSITISSAADV